MRRLALILAFPLVACSTGGRFKTDGAAGGHLGVDWPPKIDAGVKLPSIDVGAGGAAVDPLHGKSPTVSPVPPSEPPVQPPPVRFSPPEPVTAYPQEAPLGKAVAAPESRESGGVSLLTILAIIGAAILVYLAFFKKPKAPVA